MREFKIVDEYGIRTQTIRATGNMQALCFFLENPGLDIPDFPIHVHEGILLAKVHGRIFAVHDNEDKPNLYWLSKKQHCLNWAETKIRTRFKSLLSINPLSSMEVAHVV